LENNKGGILFRQFLFLKLVQAVLEKRQIEFRKISFTKLLNDLPVDTLYIFIISLDTLIAYEWSGCAKITISFNDMT